MVVTLLVLLGRGGGRGRGPARGSDADADLRAAHDDAAGRHRASERHGPQRGQAEGAGVAGGVLPVRGCEEGQERSPRVRAARRQGVETTAAGDGERARGPALSVARRAVLPCLARPARADADAGAQGRKERATRATTAARRRHVHRRRRAARPAGPAPFAGPRAPRAPGVRVGGGAPGAPRARHRHRRRVPSGTHPSGSAGSDSTTATACPRWEGSSCSLRSSVGTSRPSSGRTAAGSPPGFGRWLAGGRRSRRLRSIDSAALTEPSTVETPCPRDGQDGDRTEPRWRPRHAQRWQRQKPINMVSLGGGQDAEDTIVEIWHKPLP
jgi:hypothetical protein